MSTHGDTGVTTRAPAARSRPAGWAVVVVLAGFLALPMSMSGASVAIPRIGADLGAGGAAAQWVVTGYFLTASAFMLVAGSLGDVLGRRRVYRAGALAYATGSLAAALAPSIGVLLGARVLTGIGAAGVMAGGAAILAATFTGPARTRAFAALGTTAGLGLALGPAVSGWIVDGLGWRLGFGVFTVAGLVQAAGTLLMADSRAAHRPRIDWPGAATLVAALALLMLAVTQGAERGWASPAVLGAVVTGAVLLAVFVRVERRTSSPILDLSLLRNRRFMGWLLAGTTMAFGFGGVLAFLPSYLQAPAGFSAAGTGLVMLLPTVPMMIMPAVAGRMVNRGVSVAGLITGALLAVAAGNAWLTVLHPAVTPAELAAPLLTIGAGVGLAAGVIDAQAMNQVAADHTGMAAGMLNTVRGTANALILALFGSALIALLATRVGSADLAGRVATGNIPHTPGAGLLAAHLTDTWHTALGALAVLCAAAAVLTGLLVRDSTRTRPGS